MKDCGSGFDASFTSLKTTWQLGKYKTFQSYISSTDKLGNMNVKVCLVVLSYDDALQGGALVLMRLL